VRYAPSGEKASAEGGNDIAKQFKFQLKYTHALSMSFTRVHPVLSGPVSVSGEFPVLITFTGSAEGVLSLAVQLGLVGTLHFACAHRLQASVFTIG
jgi:hypothetical protein